MFRSSWDSGENRTEAQRVSRNQAFRYGIRASVSSVAKIEFPYTESTSCRRIFCFSGFLANIYRKYLGDDQIFWRLFCKRKAARKQRLEAAELKIERANDWKSVPRNVSSFIHNHRPLWIAKKKKQEKQQQANKSAHAKAPKLSRWSDVIWLCHRTSMMCQSPNNGQQFLPTELVFTLSRSLSAVRSQNDPGLEITQVSALPLSKMASSRIVGPHTIFVSKVPWTVCRG